MTSDVVVFMKIVTDIVQEVVGGRLSRRADVGRRRSESRSALETAGHLVKRSAYDEPNEIKEGREWGVQQEAHVR